ncbi:phenylalanine--tRNA ligase subunit beta [Gangjinia marincola]|uniref:Phenylalanine--tRNA ligase beta subunit n=1 Tax=Gangjinia marincola TaxID=578463 RepID=A0ABN1MCN4_9FLAO
MKISYNWLKQFINLTLDVTKTATLLTDLGLEVEGVESYESVKGSLEGIVVGKVLTCDQHPDADRLKLTTVDLGDGDPVQIVCGAPNVDKGQKVPVATIGTTLYDENGEPWKIKKGKIRGKESHGMICAEDELGLGKSHEGIMILDKKLKPGTPLSDVVEVETDTIFEIGLTPNRADAMSHMGVARDLKAGLLQQKAKVTFNTPSVSNFKVENRSRRFQIDVKDPLLAPRYCGVTISGLKVNDSPAWLQNKLKSIGLSPINNVVDVTNYVLHELGQPLHAFDANQLAGDKIVVKTVKAGTKFTTLDGEERALHSEDLMICDAKKPLCIAGVFGGQQSGVTENTTAIFLESAYFNPVSIRKTAKRHGLNTDASFRFERGIDPTITEYALKRAAILILELAGGEVTSDVEDVYPKKIEDFQVRLTFDKANTLIGEELPTETIKDILSSLEIKVNNVTETGLGLTIPAYRVDVQREVDVIEEILRVYGYNNIAFGTKINASVSNSSRYEDHKLQNVVGNQLAAKGFYEILNNSLTSKEHSAHVDDIDENAYVTLVNPLSTDLEVMRQNMVFSGLESLAYNINRKNEDLKLFEFGKTYHIKDDKCIEEKHLSLFITGNRTAENWNRPSATSSFFYLKGVLDGLFTKLGISGISYDTTSSALFSEGLDASANKKELVRFGVLSTSITKIMDVDQEVLYADINWQNVIDLAAKNSFKFKPIPKYPSVRRDFALLLDKQVAFNDVKQIAQKTEGKLLKEIQLFDVYEGKNLPEGKKSYAVSFTLQDEHKTLTDKQIDKVMNKLRQRFEKDLQAELR